MSVTKETIKLVAALQQGDSTAQKTFLSQFASPIFQFVVTMTSNSADAEELTQDTLLRGLRYIQRYDSSQASLSTWLLRIAYRLTLNHLQRHQQSTVPLDSVPEALLADPSSPAEGSSTDSTPDFVFGGSSTETELLYQALNHLPPDDLTLVNLFYFDNLPLREIAFITESPPGTVATRLHRIRKKLYHLIQKLKQQ